MTMMMMPIDTLASETPRSGKPLEQSSDDDADKKSHKKTKLRDKIKGLSKGTKISLVAIFLVLIGGFSYFEYLQYRYEGTDDAYVQANATQLAPKVSAIVTHVLVQENEHVKVGQILAQLDRKDYEAALRDAQATLGSLQAKLVDAEKDYRRYEKLLREKAISSQQFDHSQSNYLDLQRQVKASQAKVDEANLNLDFTAVRAPADGQIAKRSVDIGMYVAAGTAIFGFVPFDERWVDANYKETQLDSIKIGKKAEITVDALPGRKFIGIVESISPATGATFTLMPPDNATGNFTKVVQRVPVRILLKDLSAQDLVLLQAGLSANVDILKHSETEALPHYPKPIFLSEEIPTPNPPISGPVQAAGVAE